MDEYKSLVQYLDTNVFHTNNSVDNQELDAIGKQIFGSSWGGVWAEDSHVALDNSKKYYIFNTDKSSGQGVHWLGVYIDHKNHTVNIFDSFHRQLSKLVPDIDIFFHKNHFIVHGGARHIEQKDDQYDCGPRSLAWLIMVKKYGIDKIKKNL